MADQVALFEKNVSFNTPLEKSAAMAKTLATEP